MSHYRIEYKNRRTDEVKFMGIVAKSEKQAKFYFNSDEDRRKKYKIISVLHVDSGLPNTVTCTKQSGDFDDPDAHRQWQQQYHYQQKAKNSRFQ